MAQSTFEYPGSFKSTNAFPVDYYYGPYTSSTQALSAVTSAIRYTGQTVCIITNGTAQEYWFQTGTTDTSLVLKTNSISGITISQLNNKISLDGSSSATTGSIQIGNGYGFAWGTNFNNYIAGNSSGNVILHSEVTGNYSQVNLTNVSFDILNHFSTGESEINGNGNGITASWDNYNTQSTKLYLNASGTGISTSSSGINIGYLRTDNLSANTIYQLPQKTGVQTIAMLSDIGIITGGTYNGTNIILIKNDGTSIVITGITDTYVTGGTYSNGTLSLLNNKGNSFSISGFTGSGNTSTLFDTFITGGTFNQNNGVLSLVNNTGGTINITNLTYLAGNNIWTASNMFTGSISGNSTGAISAITINPTIILNSGNTFAHLLNIQGNLTAGANNQTLSGLFINPSFNNNGFTGVTNNLINLANKFKINSGGTINISSFTTTGFVKNDTSGNLVSSGITLNDEPLFTNYTQNIGVISSADTAFSAIQKLDQIHSEVGVIRTENWTNLNDWNNFGFSVSGGLLQIPDGTNDFVSFYISSKYNGTNLGTKYEKWTQTLNSFIIPTISSTSFGIMIGIKSINTTTQNSIAFKFFCDSTNKGHIKVYQQQTFATIYAQTTTPLPITAGDVTNITVKRIYNTFFIVWRNITQNKTVSLKYNVPLNTNTPPPNYGIPVIHANGGATSASTWTWTCNEFKNPDNLFICDSIGTGLLSENTNQRMKELLDKLVNEKSVFLSGSGDKIEDNNPNEVFAIAPKNIIIFCITNNGASSQSPSTMLTKLSTYISSLSGYTYGTNLFISKIIPRNDYDVSTYNTALEGVYADMIDPIYTFKAFSGTGISSTKSNDGIHLTPDSEYDLLNVFSDYLFRYNKITNSNRTIPYGRIAYYNGNNLRIGDPGISSHAADIATVNNGNQFRLGQIGGQGGTDIFLISIPGGSYFNTGMKFDGTNFISVGTAGTQIYTDTSSNLRFMVYSGAGAGQSFGPSGINSIDRFTIYTNGNTEFYSRGAGINAIELTNGAFRGYTVSQYSNTTDGARLVSQKSRDTSIAGGNTTVVNGDIAFDFIHKAADGTNKISACRVEVVIDGTVSTGNVPMARVWYTGTGNTPSEGMRLTSTSRFGVGISLPNAKIHINGSSAFKAFRTSATTLTLDNTATSWYYGGISATTWTLPLISGSTDVQYYIKNTGGANINLLTQNTDTMYYTSVLTTFSIPPNSGYMAQNDGIYWQIQ